MKKLPLDIIKMGGTLLEENAFPALAKALSAGFKKNPAVLVHGGGKEVTALAEKLKIETRFVGGRRFTDGPTMQVAEMVLAGKINPFVASSLRQRGVRALGLSGHGSGFLRAKAIKELGLVGKIDFVDAKAISALVNEGLCPVFASIAEDKKGAALNINADDMASDMAVALRARRLILFTDVPGILDAQKQTIASITPAQGAQLIQDGVITGGMIPKVQSAFLALQKGVREIWILQASLPLSRARGTVITKNPKQAKHPFQ